MRFEFEGKLVEAEEVGYVWHKNQFTKFLKCNKSEIEEIITDRLEEKDIFQWDELDIDVKILSSAEGESKHIILLGTHFVQEESLVEERLIRSVKGVIYFVKEEDLVVDQSN